MTKRTPASGKTGFLFSMLLFFVFLFCSVFTILIGSRVYENIRERDNDSFYRDTAVSYVVNKVRQADQSGGVTVGETDGGISFLLLTSQIDGAVYETWIYTMDGVLRELFTPRGSGLSVEDGLEICACPELSFSLDEPDGKRLLTISQAVSDEASPESARSVSLLLRSASGEFSLQEGSGITEETPAETETSRDFSYLGGGAEEAPARDFSYLGVPEESAGNTEAQETENGQSGQNE